MEKVGERLGKYEIRSVLGRGAMGTVYEGWDPVISRRVAIKTVRLPSSDDSEEREQLGRFQQEAQAAGRLQHPNIVGVFDYAETGELAYIVMEFVEGRTLKTMVDGGSRPGLPEIGRLMDGLLTGLAYSHGHGVIHRDIKPANIIVTPGGQVKIADFGIARIESSTMTQAGSIMGTPAYMSPEQFQGVAIDSRTDIYSAGVVLFQLLTGKRPFEGSMATIMHAVLNSSAPLPSTVDPAIPRALDAVVARSVARAPGDRYPDAAAFNRAVQAALLPGRAVIPDGLGDLLGDDLTIVTASAPKVVQAERVAEAPPGKPAVQSRRPLVLAALGALLAVGGGGAFWALSGPGKTVPTVVAAVEPPALPVRPAAPGPVMVPPAEPTVSPQPVVAPAVVAPAVVAPAIPPALPPSVESAPSTPVAAPAVAGPVAVEAPRPERVPVIAPPEPSPVVTALVAPSAETVRRAVAAAVRAAPCSFATGEERGPPSHVPTLRGAAGGGAKALRAAMQEAAPGQAFDWQVAEVGDRYCEVLDLLRPYARPFGATGRMLLVGLADGRTELQDGDLVRPRLVLPEGPSYLQLDYLASDGTVLHMHTSKPGTSYPTDAAPAFGDPKPPSFNGWGIEGPFGTELIVAVVTPAPLFRANQALPDATEGYLRELRASLGQVTRGGGRVSAFVLPIRTRPKS